MLEKMRNLVAAYRDDCGEKWYLPDYFCDELDRLGLPYTLHTGIDFWDDMNFKAFDATRNSPIFFRVTFKFDENNGWFIDDDEVEKWGEY